LVLQVIDWVACEVIVFESQEERLEQTLDGSAPPERTTDMLHQNEATAGAQHPVNFADRDPVLGDRAERQGAGDGVKALVPKVEGLSVSNP
jgi:hypothetical protein